MTQDYYTMTEQETVYASALRALIVKIQTPDLNSADGRYRFSPEQELEMLQDMHSSLATWDGKGIN